ncbi:hypothetical protein PBY51_010435 [Eleginops maclovinus]|uniref:Uncharacterized protein n=1 Tax=Eleginops maclovinus TaxID=56733 RepID=A0AAN7X3W8_ELEMC|nr:hypothetical protein PBY51_010435 [Eleginops maclovinus]
MSLSVLGCDRPMALARCTWPSLKDTFPVRFFVYFHHPASSDLRALPCRCTWPYLRLTCLPYVISKPLSVWG